MAGYALGLIETVGFPAAIEATDAALKTANVQLLGYELTRGGLVTVKLKGEVSAVSAAVNSGVYAASKVNKVHGSHVIPRPNKGLDRITQWQKNRCRGKNEPETPDSGVLIIAEETKENETHILPQLVEQAARETEAVDEQIQDGIQGDAVFPTAPGSESREKQEAGNDSEPVDTTEDTAKDSEEESAKTPDATTTDVQTDTAQKETATEDEEPIETVGTEESANHAYTCNLCRDPECPRKKGAVRRACIHYKKNKAGMRI